MAAWSKPRRRLDPVVANALVSVCRGGPWVRVDDPGAAHELVEAARFHRVAPLLAVACRAEQPAIAEEVMRDRLRAITLHLHACEALAELSEVLGDIAWVTFKGPVFSEYAHPVAGLRSYNDVDVLVAPTDLREATDRLAGAGWQLADFQDMLRNPDVPGEMHWTSPRGVMVDLHWAMVNMASRRRMFTVSSADLLRRRRPVRLGDHEIWTLDPIDTVVHACLHAALSGANKLVYLLDVDGVSRRVDDWHEVALRARSWGAQAQVALVLGRSRAVLGTTVPAAVEQDLAVPTSVRWLMRATDRLAPVQAGRSSTGANKFVARAVQPTGWGTAGALWGHGWRWAGGLGQSAPAAAGPRSAADAEALEVYLAAVEAAAKRGDSPVR